MVGETIREAGIPVEDLVEDLSVAAATVVAVPAGIPVEDLPVAEGPV
jgi:hypothetical protein